MNVNTIAATESAVGVGVGSLVAGGGVFDWRSVAVLVDRSVAVGVAVGGGIVAVDVSVEVAVTDAVIGISTTNVAGGTAVYITPQASDVRPPNSAGQNFNRR